MATDVINRKASQSLRGQAVIVTLDSTDAASLPDFSEGMVCTVLSSGETGTIYSVDYPGNSFKVKPIQPNTTFQSSTGGVYGYLAVGETVSVDN